MVRYRDEMTMYELTELGHYHNEMIYTIGSRRLHRLADVTNSQGVYKSQIGEQLSYRYIVEQVFGAGAFGEVLKCRDMKENGRIVAIKISKNTKQDTENAQIEAKILERLSRDEPDKHRLIKIYDSFFFRRHFLIVTEMLDINLFSYTKKPTFEGMMGQ